MARKSGRHQLGSRTRKAGFVGESGWTAWKLTKRPAAATTAAACIRKRPAASMTAVACTPEVTQVKFPSKDQSMLGVDLQTMSDEMARKGSKDHLGRWGSTRHIVN